MKLSFLGYCVVVGLFGLVLPTAGPAFGQEDQEQIELLSMPFGIASGQSARTSIGLNAALADGSVKFVTVRIQLLDSEGEVVAQSDRMRIEPGKLGSWDVPGEALPAGEPNGRKQVRIRALVTTHSVDYNPYVTVDFVEAAVEIVDSNTGATASITNSFSTAAFRFGQVP
jgi:hypothetical protein